jgi:hypothetical protein
VDDMLLNAENLSQIKFNTKRVQLKIADAEIIVALLPGAVFSEAIEMKGKDNNDLQSYGLKLLMTSVVDDKGNPVFTTPESFETLPPVVQKEILDEVFNYNGLSATSIKDLEKNLKATQGEDSVSV